MKCRLKFALVLASFLLGTWLNAFSQARVAGEIRDDATGEPLAGVVVQLDGGALWAISDEKGRFELTRVPEGPHEWVTECLGYLPVKQSLFIQGGKMLDPKTHKIISSHQIPISLHFWTIVNHACSSCRRVFNQLL